MSQRRDHSNEGEADLPDELVEAFQRHARSDFLPTTIASPVLEGVHHPVTRQRSVPSDRVLIEMMAALDLEEDSHVLVVGSACGYICAILADLGHTYSLLESDKDLLDRTTDTLESRGLAPRHTHVGRPAGGWPGEETFDGILVSTSQGDVPEALLSSLKEGRPLVFAEGRALAEHVIKVTYVQDGQALTEARARGRLVDRIGDILVAMDALRRDQVETAAEHAANNEQKIGESTLQLFPISDAELYDALARQHALKYTNVMQFIERVDPELIESLPAHSYDPKHLFPARLEDDVLVLATDQPQASFARLAEQVSARAVEPYLFSPTNLERLIRLTELGDTALSLDATDQEPRPTDIDALTDEELESRAVRFFETLLLDAVGERATDIHAERLDDGVRLRYRIDGELYPVEYLTIEPDELDHVINAIKVRAKMEISEPHLPHDGRLQREIGERRYDLRIHTQPTFHGETLAIRLLPQDTRQLTVDELGFPPDVADAYRQVLGDPGGLVLVVGPTGAGKTTTLYAGLSEVASDHKRKVVSVEDPVEYDLDEVQQTQIRPQAGLNFDGAVRSLVRHDPDVILIGEIRDHETAMEAIRASQTGHLVLSTLHANSTTDTLQRLLDLGVQPNSVASELRAIFAQRLARRICDGCRVRTEPDPDVIDEVFPEGPPSEMRFFRGEGCSHCSGRGLYGRIAVAEFLPTGPKLRKAIAKSLQTDQLRDIARNEGLVSMRESALAHVHNGLIPLTEVPKILVSTFAAHHGASQSTNDRS